MATLKRQQTNKILRLNRRECVDDVHVSVAMMVCLRPLGIGLSKPKNETVFIVLILKALAGNFQASRLRHWRRDAGPYT